jgi:hypothetical protein
MSTIPNRDTMVKEARKETQKTASGSKIVKTFLLMCKCPWYRDDDRVAQMGKLCSSTLTAVCYAKQLSRTPPPESACCPIDCKPSSMSIFLNGTQGLCSNLYISTSIIA